MHRAIAGARVRRVVGPLLLCLVGALILWTAAWQVKRADTVDLGGPQDGPFVQHFNTREPDPAKQPNPPYTYRWSEGTSTILWPGTGNFPLTITLRLASVPLPGASQTVTATVRGQTFPLALANELRDYSFRVERGNPLEGDVAVALTTTPFHGPGDPRELGVLVDSAIMAPIDTGVRPGVVPPPLDMARWAAVLALLYGLTWWLSGSTRAATATGIGVALFVAVEAIGERANLGFLAPEAFVLLLWAVPLAVVARWAARATLRLAAHAARQPVHLPAHGAAEAAAAALAAGWLLRIGGMVYPQFMSSDIGLHVNNIGKVLRGQWVWAGVLPNGAPQPYPPLTYLTLAPFAGLVPDLSLLLRAGVSLLDAACVLPLLYLGTRLGGARAGAWAGWVYALLPAPFTLFSAGVYANIFANIVFTWTLALWGELLLARRVTPALAAALAVGFFLTFMGHYGMLIGAVAVAAAFIVLALLSGPPILRRRALIVAGTLAVAGLAAYLTYYQHFLDVMLAQVRGVGAQVTPGGATDAAAGDVTGGSAAITPGALLNLLGRRLGPDLGAAALLATLAGWIAAGRAARGVQVLVVATALAGIGFAALSLRAGENIRYALLFAPLVAVGAGLFLSRLDRRGPAGLWWSVALVAVLAWHLLEVWVPLIFTRYH